MIRIFVHQKSNHCGIYFAFAYHLTVPVNHSRSLNFSHMKATLSIPWFPLANLKLGISSASCLDFRVAFINTANAVIPIDPTFTRKIMGQGCD